MTLPKNKRFKGVRVSTLHYPLKNQCLSMLLHAWDGVRARVHKCACLRLFAVTKTPVLQRGCAYKSANV